MNADTFNRLVSERKPNTLQDWAWQALLASFPLAECPVVWGATLQYIGWLESWPVLSSNPTTGG